MKITFVSDYLPYPPNNGVALPLYHLLNGLHKAHEVSYLFLYDGARGTLSPERQKANSALVDLGIVPVARLTRARRIANELCQVEPYFHGYDLEQMPVPDSFQNADVYIFSPFTAWSYSRAKMLNARALKIAWINDSTTAMMRSRINYLAMKGIPLRKKAHLASQWLRSLYMGNLEISALQSSDLVFVQTETERAWLDRLSHGRLNQKVKIVTNGVNEQLFSRPIVTGRRNFLFFGDMSGIYNDLVIWLLKNVWPSLRANIADSNFELVGKNASPAILELVEADSRIHYRSYVEDIQDVFAEQGVMLAPVFKNFGVINKVLEAMAAGVPVVGDQTAFNGIQGFKDGIHGYVANTAEAMVQAATQLTEDPGLYHSMASSARALMQESFSWQSRIDYVEQTLTGMMQSL